MTNLAIWVGKPYDNDTLFDSSSPIDPDKRWAPFQQLRHDIELKGGTCHTQDVCLRDGLNPDAVLFLDMPVVPVDKLLGKWGGKVRKVLFLQEPAVIMPRNWEKSRHLQFDKVLTWNDDLVDNARYVKANCPYPVPSSIPRNLEQKDRFCVIIAGHHKFNYPFELYTKREEVIRWFEANHPEDFDLYGRGWDQYVFQGIKPIRALNRIKILKKMLAPSFPSYRGPVEKKYPVLARHKFCVCYENSSDMPGYITEKIFDIFAAGCVPVYWGAPNIAAHVPADCYVDKRRFSGYEELYAHLKRMTDAEYLGYLNAIEAFVKSEKGYEFSIPKFCETVIKELP
ncbi:MAG: hypothetical protein A2234_04100 [Elusimicrobia bacterium RIFOXYA2_FULL_58_8]|nr:MAG: hypothetical protein A2285_08120 [Elusimicrobia bacterium RIFOXYA12_FULL_57_11]OGS15456.1 MAG: hypothetical protein A2234_04100 [Elusimicrobia bacterium RIFOXYA2_FULL_58_8]